MRKSLLWLAAIVPLVFGGLALPAIAASIGTTAPADPLAIDLDAIPVQPVAGPLAVQGVAGDDDDDGHAGARSAEHRKHGEIEADDEAGSHDSADQDD
ncbi:hypothetical protein C3941_21605 [Kaistia algarum]|uniref:hypothetical protein n=1 Tax=Kaistia algarum TaxID=2083279 RepID=UPI000CE88B13|nr:hypothetical protein [Kaistia algarum]MCX5515330.1 hypothetical protein [Kaistia algarum]PPE77871.1 hypothetical protein C3941_21605 [Kaistia algarum]